MNYKMIVLDLDDTLLRSDLSISPRTKSGLLEAQKLGVKVVLASGRPELGMDRVVQELHLKDYGSFILAFNGAKIINCQTNEELFSSTLPIETVQRLYEASRREGVWIHTYIGDKIITDANNPYTAIESELTGLKIIEVDRFTEVVSQPVVKVLMVADPEKLISIEQPLQKEFAGKLSVFRSKPFFLEFTEAGVTKGTSLKLLTEKLGIKREEVIAIGDSYNDLEMIEFAGLGVAMGNAADDIKTAADYVTESNMEDGVAKVVEQFILKGIPAQ